MKQEYKFSLSREEREKRRLKAGTLFKSGCTQAQVVKKLGVAASAVYDWHSLYEAGGMEALYSKGKTGKPSRITERHRKQFKAAILKGPLKQGYDTDLWTLPRLTATLKTITKHSFSDVWTWKVVRSLGFTPQKPQVKAKERDEQAIKHWKEKRLPSLKKMGEQTWVLTGF